MAAEAADRTRRVGCAGGSEDPPSVQQVANENTLRVPENMTREQADEMLTLLRQQNDTQKQVSGTVTALVVIVLLLILFGVLAAASSKF